MKVNLISFYNRFNEYPTKYSLGTLKLAAYIGQEEKIDVKIIPLDSEQNITDDSISKILEGEPDIVGIPNYMWTEELAQSISKNIGNCAPKVLKVIGGPSTNSVEFDKWNHDEIFILGEGELALMEICKAKMKDITFDSTKLSMLSAENVFSETVNLENRQVLYTSTQIPRGLPLFSDDIEKMKQDKSPEAFAWYETTRGCAYTCGYCGHKTRNNLGDVDMDIIKAEIANIRRLGITRLFIVDPIIGGKKNKGKEILELCSEQIPDTKLIAYLRPEMLDSEYVDILQRSNLEEMRFGIQTLNPNVPTWVRSNAIEKIKIELSKLKGRNIRWRAELIVGLPGDDMDGLRNSIQVVIDEFQPTVLAAYHLTAIKGTKVYDLVDGTGPKGMYLKCDKNSQAIASHSYTEQDFHKMAQYSNSITGLYNLLKKFYPQKMINFRKLEAYVLQKMPDADNKKIIEFDDEYNESFWKKKLGEQFYEKDDNDKTWRVRGEQKKDYSRTRG